MTSTLDRLDVLAVRPDGLYGWALGPEPLAWFEPGPEERHWLPLDHPDDDPKLRVARAFVAHGTGDRDLVNLHAPDLAAELEADGTMNAETMAFWLAEHGVDYHPNRHGALDPFVRLCPVVPRHARERYVITLDNWDVVLIDVALWEDDSQARVAVGDLDHDDEFCFDAEIFVTETGLPSNLPPNPGYRVQLREIDRSLWTISIDTYMIGLIGRDFHHPTRARVTVADQNEMYHAPRFDRSVRYRQLPTAHPCRPAARLRRFSETTNSIAPLDDGRYF